MGKTIIINNPDLEKLRDYLHKYFYEFPILDLKLDLIYIYMLNFIFNNMRQNSYSDEQLDYIISKAIMPLERQIEAVNSNVQKSWYR